MSLWDAWGNALHVLNGYKEDRGCRRGARVSSKQLAHNPPGLHAQALCISLCRLMLKRTL